MKDQITRRSSVLLEEAFFIECIITLSSITTEGAKLTASDDNNPHTDYALINESLESLGKKIDLSRLDSIYNSSLQKHNIKTTAFIIRTNTDGTVQENSKNEVVKKKHSLKSDKLYIRQDKSEYLQAILLNPYWTVFKEMWIFLIATIIIALLIIYCIYYQIYIINRQNRIAQLRQDFTYAMIHDMKTPITSITTGTDTLRSGKLNNDPKKIDKYLRIIEEEGQRLLSLSNKILVLAKLEQNALELNTKTTPIKPMVDDLIEKFGAKEIKEIEFTTNYIATNVYADPGYLKEAISNLIDNSIKYSGKFVNIEITTDENEEYVRIHVKDNGFGISHKDQVKIFEKFERASATKRSARGGATGFGIGLNYVQQIVEAHHGIVEIDSIEGKYSEFIINIPKLTEEL